MVSIGMRSKPLYFFVRSLLNLGGSLICDKNGKDFFVHRIGEARYAFGETGNISLL